MLYFEPMPNSIDFYKGIFLNETLTLPRITSAGLASINDSKNLFDINLKQVSYITVSSHMDLLYALSANTLPTTLIFFIFTIEVHKEELTKLAQKIIF